MILPGRASRPAPPGRPPQAMQGRPPRHERYPRRRAVPCSSSTSSRPPSQPPPRRPPPIGADSLRLPTPGDLVNQINICPGGHTVGGEEGTGGHLIVA